MVKLNRQPLISLQMVFQIYDSLQCKFDGWMYAVFLTAKISHLSLSILEADGRMHLHRTGLADRL